jgi:uncharacterized protein YerC
MGMPHVSKKLLEKENFVKIHRQLFKSITKLVSSGKTDAILGELLTKTEKLMFAKRLSIIFMIHRGESLYAIEQILKVSPSTVARIRLGYELGAYRKLIEEAREGSGFWIQLNKIIPPRVGRNRFKNFH